jgi:hypothetical protein
LSCRDAVLAIFLFSFPIVMISALPEVGVPCLVFVVVLGLDCSYLAFDVFREAGRALAGGDSLWSEICPRMASIYALNGAITVRSIATALRYSDILNE